MSHKICTCTRSDGGINRQMRRYGSRRAKTQQADGDDVNARAAGPRTGSSGGII